MPAPNLNETSDVVADSLFATAGASGLIDGQTDRDWALPVHAVLMCMAFVLVLPAGALALRFLQSVLWHGIAQAVGVLLVLIGFGIGVYVSHEYNRVCTAVVLASHSRADADESHSPSLSTPAIRSSGSSSSPQFSCSSRSAYPTTSSTFARTNRP